MSNDGPAMKSWLPQAGTVERTVFLKKLKRDLVRRGMTRQEVYKGLLQLTTATRVLAKRWRCPGDVKKKSGGNTKSVGNADLSSQERIERGSSVVRDVKIPEAKNRGTVVDTDEHRPRAPKTTTPELLDEKVGKETCFIVKIPRKAITLNLTKHKSPPEAAKVSACPAAPSTEIRMADSSVSDTETTPAFRPSIISRPRKSHDAGVTNVASKKPKIVEDVTCVEGTIFTGATLKNLPITRVIHRNIVEPTVNGSFNDEERGKESPTVPSSSILKKKRRMRSSRSCARRKQRLRRKFRQVFGNHLTESELEEEDDLIDRFSHKRRKIRGRNSLDSGVGSVDLNSDDTVVGSRGNVSDLSKNRESPFTREMTPVAETKEENAASKKPSMPLLDALLSPSDSNASRDTIVEALPDSSTNLNFFADDDSSSGASTDSGGGKLVIFESPENIESPGIPTGVSSEEAQSRLSGSTPTTGYRVVSSVPRDNGESDKWRGTTSQDLYELLTVDVVNGNCEIVLQGNTISIRENAEAVLPTEEVSREAEQAEDISTNALQSASAESSTIANSVIVSTTSCFDQIERSDRMRSDERSIEKTMKDNDVDDEKTRSIVTVRETETCVSVSQESTYVSDLPATPSEDEAVAIDATKKEEIMPKPEEARPPFLPPLPKLRVLHPSELGSRWCPTPLNNETSLLHRELTKPPPSRHFSSPPSNRLSDCAIANQSPLPVSFEQPESFDLHYRPRPRASNDAYAATRCDDSSCTKTLELIRETRDRSSNCKLPGKVSTSLQVNLLFNSIMKLLVCLDWCIGRNKLVYSTYEAIGLNGFFDAKRALLLDELLQFSRVVGTANFEWIVEYIVKKYEAITPPGKRFFNLKKVRSILSLQKLPSAYPTATKVGPQAHCVQIPAPNSGYQRLPPLSYPLSYNLPENSCCTPQQPDFMINYDQRHPTISDLSRRSASLPQTPLYSTTTIFTPRQLEILNDQIVQYNILRCIRPKQCSQRPARQRKTRAKSSVVQAKSASLMGDNTLNKENESTVLPPVVLEQTVPSVLREYRYNDVSMDLSTVQRTKSSVRSSDCAVRSSDQRAASNDDRRVERIGDILETLAVLSTQSNIDPSANDKNFVGVKTSCSLPINTEESSILVDTKETAEELPSIMDESPKEDPADIAFEDTVAPPASVNGTNVYVEAMINRVPVITLDDHDSADDTDDLARTEDGPKFSILNVKSISKDVFNSMNETASDDSALSKVTSEENLLNEVAAVMMEARECLRCGEPSSVVCEQCCEAFYCSSECHEEHWTETHHLTCKPVPAEAFAQF